MSLDEPRDRERFTRAEALSIVGVLLAQLLGAGLAVWTFSVPPSRLVGLAAVLGAIAALILGGRRAERVEERLGSSTAATVRAFAWGWLVSLPFTALLLWIVWLLDFTPST